MFKFILCLVLLYCLCSCEVSDTHPKTEDGKYIEYSGHPNLYHTGKYFDVIKLNDNTFLCIPNVSGKDVVTIKISNHEVYERKD